MRRKCTHRDIEGGDLILCWDARENTVEFCLVVDWMIYIIYGDGRFIFEYVNGRRSNQLYLNFAVPSRLTTRECI